MKIKVIIDDAYVITQEVNPHSVSQGELREDMDVQAHIDELKKAYIRRALEQSNNKLVAAAELLGLNNRQTLHKWMQRYEIERA